MKRTASSKAWAKSRDSQDAVVFFKGSGRRRRFNGIALRASQSVAGGEANSLPDHLIQALGEAGWEVKQNSGTSVKIVRWGQKLLRNRQGQSSVHADLSEWPQIGPDVLNEIQFDLGRFALVQTSLDHILGTPTRFHERVLRHVFCILSGATLDSVTSKLSSIARIAHVSLRAGQHEAVDLTFTERKETDAQVFVESVYEFSRARDGSVCVSMKSSREIS